MPSLSELITAIASVFSGIGLGPLIAGVAVVSWVGYLARRVYWAVLDDRMVDEYMSGYSEEDFSFPNGPYSEYVEVANNWGMEPIEEDAYWHVDMGDLNENEWIYLHGWEPGEYWADAYAEELSRHFGDGDSDDESDSFEFDDFPLALRSNA